MQTTDERFPARDGLLLYARHVDLPSGDSGSIARGRVVVVHGYGEHCRRYDELTQFLAERGYASSALDVRGHGRSGGQRGYVHDFGAYVADLALLCERARERSPDLPLSIVAHSNGGLIAIVAVQTGAVSPVGLALTNPLISLRPRRKPVPDFLARALSACLPRLPLPSGVDPSDLTHDAQLLEVLRTDRWVHRRGTPRWYWSMTLAGREALARAPELSLPLLLVRGDADPLVDADVAGEFFQAVGSRDKRLVTRRGELHEVLNEPARREVFGEIADFLDRVS